MPLKSKHACSFCLRTYVSQRNLNRHIKSKHSNCSISALVIQCSSCDSTFYTMESFRSHCLTDTSITEDIGSAGTPLADEPQQGSAQELSGHWTPFQPLATTQGVQIAAGENLSQPATSASVSSTATTALYGDIQQYMEAQNMSPVTDSETLPDPEPVAKKANLTPVRISNDVDPFLERLGNMERTFELRISKLENQVSHLSSTLREDILQSSSSQQHYTRSLTLALQKDITALKDLVRKLAASPRHVFTPEVVKSVVDLNGALLSIVQNEKSLSGTR